MPEFKGKEWVVFILLVLKGVSKFITEHTIVPDVNNT
jgi:hypothetical protein